jgi:hypothetical protein
MKRFLLYLSIVAIIFVAGCTDFGEENQLTLPPAPTAEITAVTPASDAVTFNLAPSGAAGYYAWLLVESASADSTLQAINILKQTATGVAKGIIEYTETPQTTVEVSGLTPFTVYQIYAVASSSDGVVSEVTNTSFRTLDDGGTPSPMNVALSEETVTITFHEPLQKGTGKVYVSYFAKNTLSGDKPLIVAPGYESYNPQDIEVDANDVSVSGMELIVKLPNAPAGAYASVTYDAGAVLDLEGNPANAYTQKADTLINGAPSRGITVHLANQIWKLHGEFDALNPDTLVSFSVWDEFVISALPDEGTKVAKKVSSKVPTVIYKQPGKTSTLDVTTWGLMDGTPAFLLPEEPAFGATVDLNVPAGAFEDVYGNTNDALTVQNNYIYSYGYSLNDLLGTWQINGISASTGAAITPEIVVIADDPDSDDENDVIIIGLAANIVGSTANVYAVFDPVMGTLTVPDWQKLIVDWTHPSAGITADVFFSTYQTSQIVFAVTSPGKITSSNDIWGYYLAKGGDYYGALRWYDTSTTWTRTSTDTTVSAVASSAAKSDFIPLYKTGRKLNK